MAETLTLSALRHLARLYRAGVEGAEDVLMEIIEERASELPDALGFPMQNLEHLRAHENPIEILVATIEGAPRVARAVRDEIYFESATMLALRLAQTAERRRDGHHVLDVALLTDMLGRYAGRVITFGPRGSVGAGRLRALVRSLRERASVIVTVTSEHIVIVYRGEQMRGLVKLVLHPVVIDHEALIVPIDLGARGDVVEDERLQSLQAPALEHEAHNRVDHPPDSGPEEARGDFERPSSVSATPETVLEPRRRPRPLPPPAPGRQRAGGFALRFVEALASAVLGGGP